MRDPVTIPDPPVSEQAPGALRGATRPGDPRPRPAGSQIRPEPLPHFLPTRIWQEWATLFLGGWYFAAAWVITDKLSYGGDLLWNNWVAGGLVFLVSLWALVLPKSPWPIWCKVVLGAWIAISPWVLRFSMQPGLNWNAWIVGGVILIIAMWALVLLNRAPAHPRRPEL